MVVPMLLKVNFHALHEVRQHARGIWVTLFVNWAVKPFSMALLGWYSYVTSSPHGFPRNRLIAISPD